MLLQLRGPLSVERLRKVFTAEAVSLQLLSFRSSNMVIFDQKMKKTRHTSSTSPKDKFRAGAAFPTAHHNQNAANKSSKSSRSQESVVPKSSKPVHEIFESTIVLEFMQWQTESKSGPGLNNHGNTCYLNSTIQCLLHTPAFTQVLLKKSSLALRGLASGNSQPNAVLHSYQR